MSDYSQGKIYIIKNDENEEVYIGSTVQTLAERLRNHKKDYKRWLDGHGHYTSSYEIVQFESCRIELLQEYPCDSGDELRKKEGEYIRQYKENCINIQIAGRTAKERYESNRDEILEYHKEYRETHKEVISEKKKKHYEDNKDKIIEHQKEYQEAHKEHIAEYKKEYYETHKEELASKRKAPIQCPNCHEIVNKAHLSRHMKTKKCQDNTKAVLVFDDSE